MTKLQGLGVSDCIVPKDSADTYGTHEDTYGIGGYRVVALYSDLINIPPQRRKLGMVVFVGDKNLEYRLTGASIPLATWQAVTSDVEWEVL